MVLDPVFDNCSNAMTDWNGVSKFTHRHAKRATEVSADLRPGDDGQRQDKKENLLVHEAPAVATVELFGQVHVTFLLWRPFARLWRWNVETPH